VTITGGFTNGLIFYTLDGGTPNMGSTVYSAPFALTNDATLTAVSLSADFAQSSGAPAVTLRIVPAYSLLTAVIGSGTIDQSPPANSYASNSVVILTAYPSFSMRLTIGPAI